MDRPLNIYTPMFYVYYIKSQVYPDKTYIGFTLDLSKRLDEHNKGKLVYTKDFKHSSIMSVFIFDKEFHITLCPDFL